MGPSAGQALVSVFPDNSWPVQMVSIVVGLQREHTPDNDHPNSTNAALDLPEVEYWSTVVLRC